MKSNYRKPIAMLLVVMMLFTLMPAGAAFGDTTVVDVTVNDDGTIATDQNGNYPQGVTSYANDSYYLNFGCAYNFSNVYFIKRLIANYATILSGNFDGVYNMQTGIIQGGTVSRLTNKGSITGGTFEGDDVQDIINEKEGTISGGTFNSLVTNKGTITGGKFEKGILNYGTVAEDVQGAVAQGGDLAITKQKLGGANVVDITVKQNGVDIPSGKAGETYNVAGFDNTLVGLYLLKDGETAPTGSFSIDANVFTAVTVVGRVTQYEFKMPDEPVTICAVFSDYTYTEPVAPVETTVTGEDSITMQKGVAYFGSGTNDGYYLLTPPDGVTFTNLTWSVSGNLPAGITLGVNTADGAGNARAFLTGTPTAMTNGSVSVTISAEATDGSNTYIGTLPVSITVEDSPAYLKLDELIQSATCKVSMTKANTEEAVVAWMQNTWLPGLNGYSELIAQLKAEGKSITVEAVSAPDESIGGFTAAVAGTKADPDGTDGSLTVRFRLDENSNYLNNAKTCTILAAKYSSGGGSSSGSSSAKQWDDTLEYDGTANPLNPGKVVFEPDDDTDLPKDAELVVKPYNPGPLDWRMLLDIGVTEYVTLDKDSIRVKDPVSLTYDGVTYSLYDIIRIDGADYLLIEVDDEGMHHRLLRLSDGVLFKFNAFTREFYPDAGGWPCEVPANKVVIINDVAYNVMCIYNASGTSNDYYEEWILYYNGEPAGRYFPNKGWTDFDGAYRKGWADFYGAYDPASVKGQKGDEFLGTVFIPEKDPGSKTREDLLADLEAAKKAYDDCLKSPRLTLRELDRLQRALRDAQKALAKYDAKAQLTPGKGYEVYAVGAQDISVEGADDVSGTVTQTFGIPAQFVGSSKVKYVAVHVTSDAETDSQFGTVTVSKDRKELEAVYHVSSFSPFVVYALVEQPDRIVMQINNTNIVVNNKTITNDVPPVIVDDRTLVPVRIVTELLGGSADWNADTRTVTLTIDGKVLNLVIGEEIPGYGTGAAIMDNRTYVPIRYVAEQLGAEVEWIADTRQIVIEK